MTGMTWGMTLGAVPRAGGECVFTVWAPRARQVDVHLIAPDERVVPLEPCERGYFRAVLEGVAAGARYRYRLRRDDGEVERPDPASRSQPEGVHGPSEVVDPRAYRWGDDAWRGVAQRDLVFYELHVGTFSEAGAFAGVIPYLGHLRDLGITALELMPVAQFPGERNWGYDGAYPFAVQHSYGGPEGLRRLVDACHRTGLAVFLDVVYNHLGPEGNYLADYGPYFTDRYHSPWGMAVNVDGAGSDEVRRYFIENALHWVEEYHLDGFRLDATDRIIDPSAAPFLRELADAVHGRAERLGRRVCVVAESDANDPRLVAPPAAGGYGLDAQWVDDFHHSLHTLLTGEATGYFADFGTLVHLTRAISQGFVYTGQYSVHRRRRHGDLPRHALPEQYVVCSQNHDQVGNRARGDRLSALVPTPALRLAAGVTILSPWLPLLFMGEEYGETAPFQYFTSHTDPALAAAVTAGRKREFEAFAWQGEVPDPQDPATFEHSRLCHRLRDEQPHAQLLAWYRELLRLRREWPVLGTGGEVAVSADEAARTLLVRRGTGDGERRACLICSFSRQPCKARMPLPSGMWRRLLDAADERWGGEGVTTPERVDSDGAVALYLPAWGFAVYVPDAEARR